MIAAGDDAAADAARLALLDPRRWEAPAMERPTDDHRVARLRADPGCARIPTRPALDGP